jgi:acetoin utilization deacetylase AcuC-like enzyme
MGGGSKVLQVFHHPNSQKHEMGEHHLEAPIRTQIIEEALKNAQFKTKFVQSKVAEENEILEIHSQALLETLKNSINHPQVFLTGDTITNPFTFDAAMTSAGGSLQVSEHIKDRSLQFAMLRPPGHHATLGVAMGFCFFNNIALAANALLKDNFNRVVILDVDNHHGNGTQGIFERHPEVLYLSLHADPRVAYPGTGYSDEIGIGEGIGTTVNVPLPYKTKDSDYLVAFDEVVTPIIEQYKPDAILVSLGIDGLEGDPYGALGLSTHLFSEIGARIGSLGERLCKKRIGVVLEGGYKYEEIGEATNLFFEGLLNPKTETTQSPDLSNKFENTLRNIKAIQRNYWFGL